MNKSIRKVNTILAVILVIQILLVAAFLIRPGSRLEVPAVVVLSPVSPSGGLPVQGPASNGGVAEPASAPTQSLPPGDVLAAAVAASGASVSVQEDHRPDGLYLTLSQGPFSPAYQVGPLAHGAYAVGPNQRFFVYVSNAGQVYALRLGEKTFVRIANLRRFFLATMKNSEPVYRLSFHDSGIAVTLIITEDSFAQRLPVILPRAITY